jgi:hypothetical protein
VCIFYVGGTDCSTTQTSKLINQSINQSINQAQYVTNSVVKYSKCQSRLLRPVLCQMNLVHVLTHSFKSTLVLSQAYTKWYLPFRTGFFKKLATAELFNKFPTCYVTRGFTIMFTRALSLDPILSQVNPIHNLHRNTT